MKKQLINIFLIIILLVVTASAQKQKVKFVSINTAGMVAGESGVYSIFQSINGFQHKTWFGGIGTVFQWLQSSLPFHSARLFSQFH